MISAIGCTQFSNEREKYDLYNSHAPKKYERAQNGALTNILTATYNQYKKWYGITLTLVSILEANRFFFPSQFEKYKIIFMF